METVRFLYKDNRLIDSLYAQIFSGLLQGVEISKKDKKGVSGSVEGKGNTEIDLVCISGEGEISAKAERQKEFETSKTDIIVSHDKIVMDVLESLRPSMKTDCGQSGFGDVLSLDGSLFFVPKQLEESAFEAFKPIILQRLDKEVEKQSKTGKKADNKDRNSVISYIKRTFLSSGEECRFLFITKANEFCMGSLKVDGFTEEPLSLFSKHLAKTIPCRMVGISEKQGAGQPIQLGQETVFGIIQKLSALNANIWSAGIPEPIAIAPIAVFYKINITD